MIRIIKSDEFSPEQIKAPEMQRDSRIEQTVDAIIADVRERGDRALIDYALRFDKARLDRVIVPGEQIEAAYQAADPAYVEMLRQAKANIESFHRRQIRHGFVVSERPGVILGQRILPLERVGLYVPGGTASYPSSVLMNAVPAKLAGVDDLVVATPPGRDGRVNPAILCAARVAGVDRIAMCGGAQAVAALAYGTESVPRVDKIVGPGNVYVATAKRRVYGACDIDMIAGPSEILIVADARAEARHLAADMLSQAEHDAHASAVLLTESMELALAVQAELERQITGLERAEIARASIEGNGRIILVSGMEQALELANRIAPEHLELMVDDPFALLGGVRNAGSVFLGKYAPEALGDYWAGPNHTLPTGGTARFSSPLSVDDFVKKSQFIHYTRDALAGAKDAIAALARSEGLTAHARSALMRFEDGEDA